MTRHEAIKDAKKRTEGSGLTWHAVMIGEGFWTNLYRWITRTQHFETVGESHREQRPTLYRFGRFKIIQTFKPTFV